MGIIEFNILKLFFFVLVYLLMGSIMFKRWIGLILFKLKWVVLWDLE